MDVFRLTKWGPPMERKIQSEIEDRVNRITPRAGPGLKITENPDGSVISLETKPSDAASAPGGGGGSGANIDLYGALNGAPALFHLVQSSAPTPL